MKYLFRSEGIYSAVNLSGFQYIAAEKGWQYDTHRHPSYELLHCLSGKIIQSIGSQTYTLYPGDTLLIQAGIFHQTNLLESGTFLDFHFDIKNPELNRQLYQRDSLLIREKESKNLSQLIHDMQMKLTLKQDETLLESSILELEIHAYLLLLLTEVIKCNRSTQALPTNAKNSNEWMLATEIAEIINQHVHSNFKISTLADQMNLTRTYLSTLFSSVYGMSPKEYHLNVKLEEAKRLLLDTYLTMDNIAETLHFSSASHFSRFFKQQSGISPSHFRNQKFQ